MLIESIIKRDPPTKVRLGSSVYQFAVNSEGAHVCDVNDQTHLARLLSIPEGYRLYMPGIPRQEAPKAPQTPVIPQTQPTLKPVEDDAQEEAEDELKGSAVHPEVIDLGDGRTVNLDDIVKQAFTDSGMSLEEWNAQDDDDRYSRIDAVLDAMVAPEETDEETADAEGDGEQAETLDREALAEEYKAVFGKRPNGRLSAEKIAEALAEAKKG